MIKKLKNTIEKVQISIKDFILGAKCLFKVVVLIIKDIKEHKNFKEPSRSLDNDNNTDSLLKITVNRLLKVIILKCFILFIILCLITRIIFFINFDIYDFYALILVFSFLLYNFLLIITDSKKLSLKIINLILTLIILMFVVFYYLVYSKIATSNTSLLFHFNHISVYRKWDQGELVTYIFDTMAILGITLTPLEIAALAKLHKTPESILEYLQSIVPVKDENSILNFLSNTWNSYKNLLFGDSCAETKIMTIVLSFFALYSVGYILGCALHWKDIQQTTTLLIDDATRVRDYGACYRSTKNLEPFLGALKDKYEEACMKIEVVGTQISDCTREVEKAQKSFNENTMSLNECNDILNKNELLLQRISTIINDEVLNYSGQSAVKPDVAALFENIATGPSKNSSNSLSSITRVMARAPQLNPFLGLSDISPDVSPASIKTKDLNID